MGTHEKRRTHNQPKGTNSMMLKINGKELTTHIKDMQLTSWEVRDSGKGHKRLYLRLKPIDKPVKLAISSK